MEVDINYFVVDKLFITLSHPLTPHSSNKGLAADYNNSKRQGAWGAILGTAVAVTAVGLVAYIILKKKQQKGFSHRKLVEEYPADPGMLDPILPLYSKC